MRKAILAGMMLLCGALAGCGVDPPDEVVPEITTAADVTSEAVTTDAEPTTSEVNTDIDIDEVLENTYLCGFQLSGEMTWGMLENTFTADLENGLNNVKKNHWICSLYYQGYNVGSICFEDCDTADKVSSDTVIKQMLIKRNDDVENLGVSVLSVKGLNFGADREAVTGVFGEGKRVTEYFEKYPCTNGKGVLTFIYTNEGTLKRWAYTTNHYSADYYDNYEE